MNYPLGQVITFDVITSNPTTGAVSDADSTPTFAVYEEVTDTDIGVGGNLTKRTSLTGNYRGQFTASSANGFEAGKFYNVICSATVNSVAGKTRALCFRIVAAENTSGVPAVDTVRINNTAQTARDIGASVLLSSGTGTGQLDFTSGVVKSNLVQILGTALTETAGLLAGGFKKFFNVASPTLTCLGIDQTGDSYARVGAPAGASVSADIAAAKTDTAAIKAKTDNLPASPASTTNITAGTITTVTNLTNAPTSGDFTSTMKTSLNAATPAVTVSDKTGFSLSSAGIQALWDALTSALTTAGSIGKLLVDNINATISSRLASASYTAPLDAAGTRAAVGLGSANLDTQLAAIPTTAPDNTSIAAIKAKTDNLPASPAAVGSAMTLTSAYDAAKTAAQPGDEMDLVDAPNATAVTAIQSGLSRLNAAGVRSAVGLASPNLDSQLDAIPTAAENAAGLLDLAAGVETGLTLRQAMRLLAAASAGKLSGAATTTITIRNAVADSKDRITAVVDSDGNRSAITVDLS